MTLRPAVQRDFSPAAARARAAGRMAPFCCPLHGYAWCSCKTPAEIEREFERAREAGKKFAAEGLGQEAPMVKACFKCIAVTNMEGGTGEVRLQAAGQVGNTDWSKWTPSGEWRMSITNPEALKQFEPGAEYAIEISKIEKVAPGT